MNCLEQFYIQLYAHNTKLVPEQTPGEFNPIFRCVYNYTVVTLPRDFDL
jgi:hypothetical protein